MHELGLMEGVLGIVLEAQREKGFGRVTRVVLEVGELSGALPEALEFCFQAVMQGSPAEGAELELARVRAELVGIDLTHKKSVGISLTAPPDTGAAR